MKSACPVNSPHCFTVTESCFNDFDALAETARGWDLDFRQLDRGCFQGELFQLGAGPVLLTRARFNRKYEQHGRASPDCFTFAVLEEGAGRVVWCREEFRQDAVACFSLDGEFEAVSDPGFQVYTLSVHKGWFASLMSQLELGPVGGREGRLVVSGPPEKVRLLRHGLRQICAASATRGFGGNDAWLQRELEEHIPRAILDCVASTKPMPTRQPYRLRNRARNTALAYIEACRERQVTVGDLCRETGASERTLQYAFQDYFGTSPKAYLKAVRLHDVRKSLRESDAASTRVADIANYWGFWHMGQFARDYRKMFGELPSQTLGRRRLRPASC